MNTKIPENHLAVTALSALLIKAKWQVNLYGSHLSGRESLLIQFTLTTRSSLRLQPTVEQSATQTRLSDFYQDGPFRITHGWHTTVQGFQTEAEGRLDLTSKD